MFIVSIRVTFPAPCKLSWEFCLRVQLTDTQRRTYSLLSGSSQLHFLFVRHTLQVHPHRTMQLVARNWKPVATLWQGETRDAFCDRWKATNLRFYHWCRWGVQGDQSFNWNSYHRQRNKRTQNCLVRFSHLDSRLSRLNRNPMATLPVK